MKAHSRSRARHPSTRVVIVGGGTGGITVAAMLRRRGFERIALIEPSETHYYQPFWTLVGATVLRTDRIAYDLLHVVPPQSAPDFIKASPLSDGSAQGWVDVDKYTLRHTRYSDAFGIGDATNTPNAKTGAAIRQQAPVLVENLMAAVEGEEVRHSYGGYGSCPLVTGYGRVLLAELDYSGRPCPSLWPLDTMKERYDMWLLKRYGIPFLYWNGMLRGLVAPPWSRS